MTLLCLFQLNICAMSDDSYSSPSQVELGCERRQNARRRCYGEHGVRLCSAMLTNAYSVDYCRSVVHGAQETTSSAMARLLSLMATHPNLQIRIRQELIDAKKV